MRGIRVKGRLQGWTAAGGSLNWAVNGPEVLPNLSAARLGSVIVRRGGVNLSARLDALAFSYLSRANTDHEAFAARQRAIDIKELARRCCDDRLILA